MQKEAQLLASLLLHLPLLHWPLPPLSYRPGVQGIMAIGIKPQAMAEGCLPREGLFGHAVQVVDEPTVRVLQLPQDFGERYIPFLFRHLCIEGIDAARLDISRWSASGEDQRQILQGLLLPGGHVRKDIFHRPLAHDAGLRELCIGQADVGLLERRPGLLQFRIASWEILRCPLQTPLFLRLSTGLSSRPQRRSSALEHERKTVYVKEKEEDV